VLQESCCVSKNTANVLKVASPFSSRVYDNCYSDAGYTVNSYWQSSWMLGDKFSIGFNAAELEQHSAGVDRFHATFPLSHL